MTRYGKWGARTITRRQWVLRAPALIGLPILGGVACRPDTERGAEAGSLPELLALEASAGGRLGVCFLDTATGIAVGHRLDERFGMCSTFELLLAGLVLREVDAGRLSLDQPVSFGPDDMVPYAPVTERYLDVGEMTVGALAEAAQTTSDNVAANLLLGLLDGPAGFTARMRELGDPDTRLDRIEPELNIVPRGEIRDTTTPLAMSRSAARFLDPVTLTIGSRQRLWSWMRSTQTGLARIRAGLPTDWPAGDKTGTARAQGIANKHNDVAVARPTPEQALVITAFYEADGAYPESRSQDDEVVAGVGGIAARWWITQS